MEGLLKQDYHWSYKQEKSVLGSEIPSPTFFIW
jgi:hypothetical protein